MDKRQKGGQANVAVLSPDKMPYDMRSEDPAFLGIAVRVVDEDDLDYETLMNSASVRGGKSFDLDACVRAAGSSV